MIILSDIHIGTQRQAGTTPASQSALKAFIQSEFNQLVGQADCHLVINGDLFDAFSVDPSEVVVAYETLANHLENGGYLTLGMGNHDASAKGDRMSSFHLLARILWSRFPSRVVMVDHTCGLTLVQDINGDTDLGVWMIPHMLNQDLFDIEIQKAIDAPGKYLLLHCNVMSEFAQHDDHSLNLDEDQLDALVDAGWTLIVGHEHQRKTYKSGRCVVPGNQIPTSVSDCLGNKDMKKYYTRLTDKGLTMVTWTNLAYVYTAVDWQDIGLTVLENFKFIRVTGNATAEQAAEMVGIVAKLRQKHDAFVISNAVKVEGVAQMDDMLALSAEGISKFDVLGALYEELDERERKTVEELLK